MGLAVHFGYSGLLNFGQAGFMAVGAYGFAISTLTFKAPFFVALLIAILCSVIFAFILGIPTLRLRADYLAIVTIASAEIVRYVVTTNQLTSVTGSANGLAAFEGDFYSMNPFPEGSYLGMNNRDFFIRVVGWTLVIICCLLVWLLMRSPWGRVLKGIREDENAVRSLGKNVYAYKMQALVIGGVLGARQRRVQVRAAAEPLLRRAQEPRVHMDGGHVRIGHVRDQADAGGEEARIVGGAVDRLGEIAFEASAHGRDVDADLLEDAALHHAAHPATARRAVRVGSVPGRVFERRLRSRLSLDGFERGADAVAQRFEPGARRGLLLVQFDHSGSAPISVSRLWG